MEFTSDNLKVKKQTLQKCIKVYLEKQKVIFLQDQMYQQVYSFFYCKYIIFS